MHGFLLLAILCSFGQAANSYRAMLNNILVFRSGISQLNIYPALRLYMKLQPIENPVLSKAFRKACSCHDLEYAHKTTRGLFHTDWTLYVMMKSIPNDLTELFPHRQLEKITLNSLVQKVPIEQKYFVQMALYEWNYLTSGIPDASPDIAKLIKTVINAKMVKSMSERLDMAKSILEHLAVQKMFVIKDSWVVYHLLEYLRYLMVLQWSTSMEQGLVDRLELLWITFAIVTLTDSLPMEQTKTQDFNFIESNEIYSMNEYR